MEPVPLEIILISAHDLDPFGFSSSSSMEVYAVVYVMVGNDIYAMQQIPPDEAAGNNPAWCFTAHFVVPRDGRHLQHLHFSLHCRCPSGDYGVGDVRISLEELLRLVSKSREGPPWSAKFSHPVTTPWGWRRGTLRFRLRYGHEAAGGGDAAASEHYPPPERRLSVRLMDGVGMVAWVLLGLLLRRILCEAHLARPLLPPPPPPPVMIVYRYPALPPPPTPAPAMGIGLHWMALLMLGGLLVAIHHRGR